jgi:hypothetical protein
LAQAHALRIALNAVHIAAKVKIINLKCFVFCHLDTTRQVTNLFEMYSQSKGESSIQCKALFENSSQLLLDG